MQQTPSFLPIPSSTGHGPKPGLNRQGSFGGGSLEAGPSRWGDGSVGSMTMMPMGTPPNASPSSNPHSGFHPGSYGAPLSFSALALGATQPGSSPYSSSMAMSISPPRWGGPGSLGGGFGGSGSFVGSVGALGTSFGRHTESRDRELEAKYVKDFTCCGRRLSGLHELLEHYEEEHANLAPDVRMAAISAVQSNPGAKRGFTPNVASTSTMGHSDVPVTPGMMDMDMDEPAPTTAPQGLFQQTSGITGISINVNPTTTSPWSAAFRPSNLQPPACVPPSVLSYAPPAPSTPTAQQQSAPQRLQTPTTPTSQSQSQSQPQQQQQQQQQQQSANLSQAEIEARLFKKAAKKAEQRAAKESGEDDHEAPSEKRFRCPIEGCGKVYKQANGLKYHLTRSINSGHGNVAAMGGLLSLLGEDKV